MGRLNLSFAVCKYDHMRDIINRTIEPEGIDLNVMLFDNPSKIFHRATNFGDFDVCELSFGRQIALVSQMKNEMVAIPVFPSRMGRISGFYLRADSKIQKPSDLAGKTIGVPEWAMTATIFGRGWLSEYAGVDLRSIDWVQAGSEMPGRKEPVDLHLPEGMRLRAVEDRSLVDMLVSGEIDCLLSAQAPQRFRSGDGSLRRLVPDYRNVEMDYYRATGIFPIMHLIAIRRSIYEEHPWVAVNLFEAFEQSKNNALERLPKVNHAMYPVPWLQEYVRELQSVFGRDIWPYGLAPNIRTVEAFLRFGFDQGVCARKLVPADVFVPQTLNLAKA
jgi:4,5-dihydroxyphthalate decarboxylase